APAPDGSTTGSMVESPFRKWTDGSGWWSDSKTSQSARPFERCVFSRRPRSSGMNEEADRFIMIENPCWDTRDYADWLEIIPELELRLGRAMDDFGPCG